MIRRICELCSALMRQHPEHKAWNKCPSCGFCKEIKHMSDKLTLDMYKMGRDKQFPTEWTTELENNANKLIAAVNGLLQDLKFEEVVSVSSGWRPAAVNAKVANAAKKSLHMTGLAVDLKDTDGSLDEMFKAVPELLRKYGLFLESPDHTKGWAHLDISPTRADRPSRVFIP